MEYVTVLGASGLLGKAVTDNLLRRGYNVKILVRDIEQFEEMYIDRNIPGRVDAIIGELDSNIALANALEYSDTVFLCYNTELSRWDSDLPRWTSKIGDLCAALQARIIYPGCIMNYGPNTTSPIVEEEEQNSPADKGQLKIALEQRLGSSAIKGATLSIVRLPELFGPTNNDQIISRVFRAASEPSVATWYGNPKLQHEFLYCEDAANALVEIALSEKTKDTMIHVSGHRLSPDEFIRKIYDHTNIDVYPPYKMSSKVLSGLKSIINKNEAELKELMYLYSSELFLDNTKYVELIGEQKLTDLDDSIKKTLDWFRYWYNDASV